MGAPTAILTAVSAAIGDPALLREALRADPAGVSALSPDGWPALRLAAHFGHGDAVDALPAARADVRACSDNEERNTALHAARAGRGGLRIVSALLARRSNVNAPAGGGYTPLHGAAAEALAADGRTALEIAEGKGHAPAARRLRGEVP